MKNFIDDFREEKKIYILISLRSLVQFHVTLSVRNEKKTFKSL